MEIYKVVVRVKEDGRHYLIDGIEEDGKFWLVPKWLEKGFMPARMVCITEFRPRKLPVSGDGIQRAHFEITDTLLPRALLDGSELGDLASRYEVREGDEVLANATQIRPGRKS